MTLQEALTELGFTAMTELRDQAQNEADAAGLSDAGTYSVHGMWVRDDIVVRLEQNQAPEVLSGMQALITHPAVAVMSSPKGTRAFNPEDFELAAILAQELA